MNHKVWTFDLEVSESERGSVRRKTGSDVGPPSPEKVQTLNPRLNPKPRKSLEASLTAVPKSLRHFLADT